MLEGGRESKKIDSEMENFEEWFLMLQKLKSCAMYNNIELKNEMKCAGGRKMDNFYLQ